MQTRNGGRDRGAFSQVACKGTHGTSGAPSAFGTVAAHGWASTLSLSRPVRAEGPSCRERHRVQVDTEGRTWQRAGRLLVKGPFLSDYRGSPRGGTLRGSPLALGGDVAPARQGYSASADHSHQSLASGASTLQACSLEGVVRATRGPQSPLREPPRPVAVGPAATALAALQLRVRLSPPRAAVG